MDAADQAGAALTGLRVPGGPPLSSPLLWAYNQSSNEPSFRGPCLWSGSVMHAQNTHHYCGQLLQQVAGQEEGSCRRLQEESETDGPMGVLDFWAKREANLQNVRWQLDSTAIAKVSGILEASKSSYFPAFSRRGLFSSCPNPEVLQVQFASA